MTTPAKTTRKDPARVAAAKKAARTRARNAAKNPPSRGRRRPAAKAKVPAGDLAIGGAAAVGGTFVGQRFLAPGMLRDAVTIYAPVAGGLLGLLAGKGKHAIAGAMSLGAGLANATSRFFGTNPPPPGRYEVIAPAALPAPGAASSALDAFSLADLASF